MCGLVGFSAKKNKKPDRSLINYLGADNDSRGRDSVGILINDTNHISLGTYKEFIKKKKFNYQDAKSIMIHTRKKSSGYVNIASAHPYHIKGSKHELFLMHNGTLQNEALLADYYGISSKDYTTDSELLGKIIGENGHEELFSLYAGAANVIFKYAGENTLYIWRGDPKFAADQRPLYNYEDDNGFYISSIEDAFNHITTDYKTFKGNALTIIKNGNVEKVVEYARTPLEVSVNNFTSTNPAGKRQGLVYWDNGLYKRNGHNISGHLYLTNEGEALYNEAEKEEAEIIRYFYHGFMCKDVVAYEKIKDKPLHTFRALDAKYLKTIAHDDMIFKNKKGNYFQNGTFVGNLTINPVFSDYIYEFEQSRLVGETFIEDQNEILFQVVDSIKTDVRDYLLDADSYNLDPVEPGLLYLKAIEKLDDMADFELNDFINKN